jgi:hypothetical protein
MLARRLALGALCGALSTAACKGDEQPAPTLAPTASALAVSKSESRAAAKWTIDEAGKASFVMAGKLETIQGDATRMRGNLEIDLADLTKTRGSIECDMTTLVTRTFEDVEKNQKQTVDALTWLEVHERGADPAKIEEHRWAVFAIREITKAEPKDLSQGGAARSTKVTAKGELLLHGRKSDHTVELDASVAFDGEKPKSLTLKTSKPFTVSLIAHDVKPRDNVGKLLQTVTQTLRDKVSESADASLEITARPAP